MQEKLNLTRLTEGLIVQRFLRLSAPHCLFGSFGVWMCQRDLLDLELLHLNLLQIVYPKPEG